MLGIGIGASDQDPELGVVSTAGPDLRAVDDVDVAVANRSCDEMARSDPASGSEKSWHQKSSPLKTSSGSARVVGGAGGEDRGCGPADADGVLGRLTPAW